MVDLVVDGRLSVSEAHSIGTEVVKAICRHFPGAYVTFHLEPAEHADEDGPDPTGPAAAPGPTGAPPAAMGGAGS
jgi:divalent metal cation (Fe/Co/Zn/Cd) transporter